MKKILSIACLMLVMVTYVLPLTSIELGATEISPIAAGDCYTFSADITNQTECNGSIQNPNFNDTSAWQTVDGTVDISGGVADISDESIYQDVVFNGGEKFYIVISGRDNGSGDDIIVETGAPGAATKDDTVATTGNTSRTDVLSEVYSVAESDAQTNSFGDRKYLLEVPESDGPITVRIRIASTGKGEVLMQSVDDSGAAKFDMQSTTDLSSNSTEFTHTAEITKLDGEDLTLPTYQLQVSNYILASSSSDFNVVVTEGGTDVTSDFNVTLSGSILTVKNTDGTDYSDLVIEVKGTIDPDSYNSSDLVVSNDAVLAFDSASGEEPANDLPFFIEDNSAATINDSSIVNISSSISEPTDEIADENEQITLTLDIEHESGFYVYNPSVSVAVEDINDIDTSSISVDNSDYTFTVVGNEIVLTSNKTLSEGDIDQVNLTFTMSDSFSANETLKTTSTLTSDYYTATDINADSEIELGIKPVISANDFSITSDETLDVDSAISLSEASAENEYTGEEYEVSVDEDQLTTINNSDFGLYPLTFTTIEDESVEVNVLVTNEDSVSSSTEALNAYDFTISVDDAASLTASDVDTLSEVQAISLTDGSEILATLTADSTDVITQINNSQGGLYMVTYETESGDLTKDVYITVDPGDDSLSGDTLIVAEDFQYNNSEELSEQDAIDLASSVATNIKDGSNVDVVVDAEQLATINGATPGYYPLTFTSDNSDAATITIQVLVYNDDSVLNLEDGEMISANGFNISSEDADKLSDEDFSNLAGSIAYDLESTDELDVEVSLESKDDYTAILNGEVGFYSITLETETGKTSTSIDVVVYSNEGNLDLTSGEYIGAESITVKSEDITGVTEAQLIELMNAEAFNIYTGEDLTVSISDSSLDSFESIQAGFNGEYEITFVTESGTEYSATITVTDQIIQITGLNTNVFAMTVFAVITLALFGLRKKLFNK